MMMMMMRYVDKNDMKIGLSSQRQRRRQEQQQQQQPQKRFFFTLNKFDNEFIEASITCWYAFCNE